MADKQSRNALLGLAAHTDAEQIALHAELARLRAEVAQAPTREMLLKMNAQLEANAVGLTQMLADQQAEVARLTREIADVERFRAAPLNTIRKLLGDEESPDEAIAGSVCAILLTRQETVRRKQVAEKERDTLRAALQALADAADARLFDANWLPLLNARRVLAAGEK